MNLRLATFAGLWLLGCASSSASSPPPASPPKPDATLPALPWEAAVRPPPAPAKAPPVALLGGTIMTASGRTVPDGVLLMRDGRIAAVGARSEVVVPADAERVDVKGRTLTPGLIDTHSHMGVYPVPSLRANWDGNEASAPVTAQVHAADSFWPQDPALTRALAAGVTTIQILPGSANLIGGRGQVLKLHLGLSAARMAFPDAPATLKMACGENPKRVHGKKGAPQTRMGNVAGYRAAYQKAREYGRGYRDWQAKHRLWQLKRNKFEAASTPAGPPVRDAGSGSAKKPPEDPGPAPAPPARNFGLETLLGVIEGRVHVHMHCYRADEMLRMLALGEEFGFRIRSFHHAVEAYKLRAELARAGVGVSTWADWWGIKLELFDAVVENLALLSEAGTTAALHSDSPMLVQRLNQEAAKAMYAGRAAGIEVDEDLALRWITRNAAWVLGVEDQTGSLEVGKMADVVVWSGSPFSVYSRTERVYLDGLLVFDRSRGRQAGRSDFELGLHPEVP